MKNSDLIIRELTIDDSRTYAEFVAMNHQTSGLGDTPIFAIYSRRAPINIESGIKRIHESFNVPLGNPGWEKRWGAITKDHRMVGDLILSTTRLPPAQMHRAILAIGLDVQFRNRRLGGDLMAIALDWAKAQSFLAWIDLGVFAHNAPARKLYERFGFRETGRVIDAFRVEDQRIDDIQMSLELSQYVQPRKGV